MKLIGMTAAVAMAVLPAISMADGNGVQAVASQTTIAQIDGEAAVTPGGVANDPATGLTGLPALLEVLLAAGVVAALVGGVILITNSDGSTTTIRTTTPSS